MPNLLFCFPSLGWHRERPLIATMLCPYIESITRTRIRRSTTSSKCISFKTCPLMSMRTRAIPWIYTYIAHVTLHYSALHDLHMHVHLCIFLQHANGLHWVVAPARSLGLLRQIGARWDPAQVKECITSLNSLFETGAIYFTHRLRDSYLQIPNISQPMKVRTMLVIGLTALKLKL